MWYNKGSVCCTRRGFYNSWRVCLRVVQGGEKMRKHKNILALIILGCIIGAAGALGQGQENVTLNILAILACICALIVYRLRTR